MYFRNILYLYFHVHVNIIFNLIVPNQLINSS